MKSAFLHVCWASGHGLMRLIMPVYKIWEICTYEVITDAFAGGSGINGNRYWVRHPITGFALLWMFQYNMYFEGKTKSQLFLHIIYTYLFKFCLFICNALNRNYVHTNMLIYVVRMVDLIWVSKVVGEPACSTAHNYNFEL